MGLFNVVRGEVTCPRCGRRVEAAVEVRLGYVHEGRTLRVGDPYPWNHPAMPSERPPGTRRSRRPRRSRPACDRDFFVRVVDGLLGKSAQSGT